nr:hypothetical protein [Tanacetum cinerariifolium]
LFSPLKLDLSNSRLEEFQQLEFEGYGPKTSKSISKDISNEVKESPDAVLVKELVKPRRQDLEETQHSGPTTNVADDALNKENVPTRSNDPPLSRVNTLRSGEDRLKLNELMELYTKLSKMVLNMKTTKTAPAKEISRLKKRVKRLEKRKKLRTPGLKRLYKVVLSARVESLNKESLEDQGRVNDEEMFDTDVLNDEEIFVKSVDVVEQAK